MRCETAKRRLPEPRARRHAERCRACSSWVERVERARASTAAAFQPVPSGLATRVLAATREPSTAPHERPVAPRHRTLSRLSAAAAAVILVGGGAAIWLLASGGRPAEAVASAAERTGDAETARFTFEGDFSVRLRVPDDVVDGLNDGLLGGPGGLSRALIPPAIPPEIRKGVERHLELGRRWLMGRVGEGLGALEAFSPRVRVTVTGDGEFAARDRARVDASVSVSEPAPAGGSFELVQVGDELFVQVGSTGWRAGAGGIPARVLSPVALGLGRLADWIGADARRAESLGRVTLEGVETERFRLDLPARADGVVNRVDVWIGADDGLVHRVLITHRVERPFSEISGTIDVRLFDHGAELDIRRPEGVERLPGWTLPAELGARLGEIDVWLGAGLPGPPLPPGFPEP